MGSVIVRVEAAVEIGVPVSPVFALVSDPPAKARLNPFLQVIRIEREECEITPAMLEHLPVPRRAERAWRTIMTKCVRLFGGSSVRLFREPPNHRTVELPNVFEKD